MTQQSPQNLGPDQATLNSITSSPIVYLLIISLCSLLFPFTLNVLQQLAVRTWFCRRFPNKTKFFLPTVANFLLGGGSVGILSTLQGQFKLP